MKNALKVASLAVSVFLSFAAVPAPVWAQHTDAEKEPTPIPFAQLDLNGSWSFKISEPTVTGKCPAGHALTGTAAITQRGTEVTLKYLSGPKCRPAEVCSYTGTLDDENQFVVANSVVVDNEGGKVMNEIRLTLFNNEQARGEATNHYIHPSGFECLWKANVVYTRELQEEE